MDYDLGLAATVRRLVSRVERHGSPRALKSMNDAELEEWIGLCSEMLARPGRANGTYRQWRRLLQDARIEHAARHSKRRRSV
jgi:hypothetical protein